MKILQVNSSDMGGGAEGSSWNLFKSYRNRGYASWLAVGEKKSNDSDVYLIPNEHFRPVWVRYWRRAINRIPFSSSPLVANLISIMNNLPTALGQEDFNWPGTRQILRLPPEMPDILHCHNLHGNYFDLRLLPWLTRRVPVILNLRDAWLLSGHCAHSFACDRWKTGCGQCPDLTIYPSVKRDATAFNWHRKRKIFSRSRLYITTVSNWLMDQVHRSMIHGISYKVIPNGIDLTIFHPGDKYAARDKLGIPQHSKIVLYAANSGRSSRWRDFSQLERSLLQIANPDLGKLTLICLGEEQNSNEILRDDLHVHFHQFEQESSRMALYYQAADVYVLPAVAEAFGKTITEAMACGTPVVATSVGGIVEQITDGITGFLVRMSDVSAMADAIQFLLVDEVRRINMGNTAANYARQHFGLERQVDGFLNWYSEVRSDWLEWRGNG